MNGLLFLSIPPFASEIDSLNATSRTSRYMPDFSPIHQTQSCKEKKKKSNQSFLSSNPFQDSAWSKACHKYLN